MRKKSQRMILKRALLVLLGSHVPFLLLLLGVSPELSCDKKEQMNLLRYHFTYHYLCSKCLIYLDCLNETFIVPHFSSLATCSFRDWLSPASSDIHKFLTGHWSLAPLPRSLVFVLSHYQGPRCLDPTDFQATKSGLLQP